MAQQANLRAKKRDLSGSAESGRLRRAGIVPGVVYGASQDNYSVQVDAKEFTDLLRHSASEQILVNLQIEGAKESDKLALIKEVQHNALTGAILHIDFNAVNEHKPLHARVPIELTGEPIGIKTGGILDTLLHEIEVSCLPKDLPEILRFDVSSLDIGSSLSIGAAPFPDGVTPALDDSVLIGIVNETRAAVAAGDEDDAEEEGEAEGAEGEEGKDKEAESGD